MQGFLISLPVIAAYHIGLEDDSLHAATMAFATLTLARLFHGFNCRGESSVFHLPANYYSIGAFALGALLLLAVLMIAGLHSVFDISPEFVTGDILKIIAYAILPTALIQMYRVIKER